MTTTAVFDRACHATTTPSRVLSGTASDASASVVDVDMTSLIIQIVAPAGTRVRHQGAALPLGQDAIFGTDMVSLEVDPPQGLLNRLDADAPFRATMFLLDDGVGAAWPINQAHHIAPEYQAAATPASGTSGSVTDSSQR